ncbi:cytochrome b [Chitinilyticum litopenaei]|uniref:cytochrome b n=1 Tax=Chitinilyticum litopenaei TaxID=1121276 RepID=UPI0003FAA045|nr:cytochrome b [Chitinilyticum litopenaei]
MTRSKPDHYDGLQILLHWGVALLIAGVFTVALVFDDMPLSPAKFALISWHKWLGMVVLMLVVARLVWRLVRGAPEPDASLPAWQRKLAAGVHHLLYLLMFALPMAGWLMSSAKGYSVVLFGKLPLPDLVGKNEELGHLLKDAHELMAWTLLVLVVLHAAAAIKHHVIDRDTTLSRMLPFLRRK